MGSSSRAPPPAPLYTTAPGGAGAGRSMSMPTPSTSSYESTPRSAGAVSSFTSASASTSASAPGLPPSRQSRVNSAGPAAGPGGRKASSHSVNVHTHCGRHSDQFLFGGWGPIVRGVFQKKN